MKDFNGRVLFLDRDDINTDEIIPAKYLTEITKEALKPYLLEDLKLEGFDPTKDIEGKTIIVTKKNFGCGSSREHAPWALEVNNINLVIANNFARIFRQNMFNCGMMAVELDENIIEDLFTTFKNKEVSISTNWEAQEFLFKGNNQEKKVQFSIGKFDQSLVEAGGWVDYADKHY
jgi:3-isopropylmalate/(R)-2-methylmalate dehydratase small subunit